MVRSPPTHSCSQIVCVCAWYLVCAGSCILLYDMCLCLYSRSCILTSPVCSGLFVCSVPPVRLPLLPRSPCLSGRSLILLRRLLPEEPLVCVCWRSQSGSVSVPSGTPPGQSQIQIFASSHTELSTI